MPTARRRTVATYSIALMLPVVLFAALQAAFSMRTLRAQIESTALAQSREINALVDGQLRADQSALQVLSTSQHILDRDWPAARQRAAGVARLRPGWKNVILTDVRTGREIWATHPGPATRTPMRPWMAKLLGPGGEPAPFTGVVGTAPECPCVSINVAVPEPGPPHYVLTAEVSPQMFQDILLPKAPAHSTSAIVDRNGLFIARTVAYPTKLGTPATHFVRDAIARSSRGLYPGVTYEGVKNYTAFETSALTGWSTHIAVKAELLSGPRLGSIILTGVAAIAALLLAFGIAAFAYRQSRLRRLEDARSAQSQKLAAVGQLAAGIAHDFNNLLMVIAGSLERISEKAQDPNLRRPIENALLASERGTMLIRQLLAFTRSQPLEIGAVDLMSILANLGGILQQSVGETVNLTIEISPDARWVTTSGPQLEMALVNLAVNARDAMASGGVLDIRSRLSKGLPGCIDLDVSDTGEGMPKEVVDRAMEPFFTTKPLGKGTGLGLAQVFGVVSQSGGSVEIHSELGRGTTITLRFKAAESG